MTRTTNWQTNLWELYKPTTMSIEPFALGSRKRRLSRQEIQKMKRNMKKVPLIKEKAELYTAQERLQAEKYFDQHVNDEDIPDTQNQEMPS